MNNSANKQLVDNFYVCYIFVNIQLNCQPGLTGSKPFADVWNRFTAFTLNQVQFSFYKANFIVQIVTLFFWSAAK